MINHWMFNCKEVDKRLSRYLDEDLPFWERAGVRFHLFICKLCTSHYQQLQTVKHLVKFKRQESGPRESVMSDEAKNRIKQCMYKEMFKSDPE